MSFDADTIVDRRRMRRKLTLWRVFAVLLAICALVAVGAALRAPGTGMFAGATAGSIARVTITGLIRTDRERVEALERLAKSPAKAVIVHINSPGGTTAGSEELYDSLMQLREQKPTVVVVDGLAASGGYIAALGGDRIVAQETSLVGSIGVLFQYPNVADLLKTIGVQVETIKSSPLKAAPSGFEPTSPEARAAVEEIVMDTYAWFKELVQKRRNSTKQRSPRYRTGGSSPAGRAWRSSSSTNLAARRPRSPGSRKRRTSIPRRRCATSG